MPRQTTIKFLRTTKANLDAQKAISNLIVGEPYLITDTSQFAIADAPNNYKLYYSASEVQTALDDKAEISDIPTTLSELSDDSTHRLVTDTEKNTWNGKQDLLVNQTNIKSINNTSLLGSGNIDISGGGSLTIENNGVDLTAQPKLNFVGKQLIADNATNQSTDIQMFPNMPPDSYINQNVYPALEWVWKHTDGYWYYVTMVLSQASGYVGNTGRKFKVYKTLDWVNHIEVCSYENTSYNMKEPKITLDSSGNILVITSDSGNFLRAIFFDVSNSYTATVTANISENTSYSPETTISLNVSADNRFGVAFFQKHTGSTSYSQLMYVERSAGSGGTWGTPEILGATPLRATTATSQGAIQLFYTSTNEPIIAFLNNASAASSKAAVAKKVTGTWTIYDDTRTVLYDAIITTDDSLHYSSVATLRKFDNLTNSFSNSVSSVCFGTAIDAVNNLYAYTSNPTSAPINANKYYVKNDTNTFHRAISAYFQIGAAISNNAMSTFGIYTVIPYSRQRLENAYHLVIRTDGAIFMEVI